MHSPLPTFALIATVAIFAPGLQAQQASLVKKWETEATLLTPESVRFDGRHKVLYVSNVEGSEPWTKDGAGSIAKVGLDGKVIAARWITGLEAPKGIGLHKGRLYVADIDRVAVIDIAKGVIERFIEVPGSKRLNDVSVDASGDVYVSDMGGTKIYVIRNGSPSVYLEGFKRPNGVLAHKGSLYVLDAENLLKFGSDKKREVIVDGLDPSSDGIEHVKGDTFLVTCWTGLIYLVEGHEKALLLDTRAQKSNTADIGYDAKTRTVYVPTFFKNSVAAYDLKLK
ncbi:MAG: SMP-30/gluconolactonase/LRE family protein [Opitutaceae bacterium]|nr:SMP-30/gluconolactonase/LRE family protein [Opitutaceae bacterium]